MPLLVNSKLAIHSELHVSSSEGTTFSSAGEDSMLDLLVESTGTKAAKQKRNQDAH